MVIQKSKYNSEDLVPEIFYTKWVISYIKYNGAHEAAPGSLMTPRKSSFIVPMQNCKKKKNQLTPGKKKRNSNKLIIQYHLLY